MSGKNVKAFFKAAFTKNEDEYFPLRYDDYIYHSLRRAYVCRVQKVGTKTFVYMTPSEIINDEGVLSNFSSKDGVIIERHFQSEKARRNKLELLETDTIKGTVLFKDYQGKKTRYAEKTILLDEELQNKISSKVVAQIGYRAGVKDGAKSADKTRKGKLKATIISKLPFNKKTKD